MQRFFIDATKIKDVTVQIDDVKLLHQIIHVLRLKIGDDVIFLDNSGAEYLSKLTVLAKRQGQARVIKKLPPQNDREISQRIFVYQSIPKTMAKFELVLQKGTELGVSGFYPLITKRTEVRNLRNKQRMEAIIKEAAEQCGAVKLPALLDPVKLDDIYKNTPNGMVLFTYEKEVKTLLKDILPKIKKAEEVHVIIGPEGGFDDSEIKVAKNIATVGLGKRILRTETAALAVVSAITLS